MNRKTILSIVLIAIVVLAFTAWFVCNHISELQNQISELQIQNSELQGQNSELQDELRELQDLLLELQNQLAELQNKTGVAPDMKIIAFEWLGGFNPVGGLTLAHPVEVTVRNNGTNDLSGLTLTVKLVYRETNTEVAERGYVTQIDVIHAGEVLKFSGEIWASLGSFSKDSAKCVITLTWGDVVLDEWIRGLTTVY